MCFEIMLKLTKNQGCTLSSEDAFFEKPQGRGQFEPPRQIRVKCNQLFARGYHVESTEFKM